jgi:hypothetical protein
MTAPARAHPGAERLVRRGAERGAAALEALLGGAVRCGPAFEPDAGGLAAYAAGVCFALDGALEGAVALLFASGAPAALLEALGPAAAADPRSALAEVANIVASQALAAFAEELGAPVGLSIPELALRGAGAALAAHAAAPGKALACELRGPGAGLRLLFALAPGAAGPSCDTVGA